MKSSSAFILTTDFVAEFTDKIFSLGYVQIIPSDGLLPIPLFWLGKLAKYVIGYPLGVIAGGFAAGIVALFNLFTPNQKDDSLSQSQESLQAEINDSCDTAPPVVSRSLSQLNEIPVVAVTPQIDESILNEKKEKQRILNDKKDKLRAKITLLTQTIDAKIASFEPTCKAYDDLEKHCEQLESELQGEEWAATNAQRFSHHKTLTKEKVSCPCGRNMGFLCQACRMPVFRSTVTEQIAVYIPDLDKRSAAKDKCALLSEELSVESEKLLSPPAEYGVRKSLVLIKEKLRELVLDIEWWRAGASELAQQLATYKTILDRIELLFSPGDAFIKDDYLPLSTDVLVEELPEGTVNCDVQAFERNAVTNQSIQASSSTPADLVAATCSRNYGDLNRFHQSVSAQTVQPKIDQAASIFSASLGCFESV